MTETLKSDGNKAPSPKSLAAAEKRLSNILRKIKASGLDLTDLPSLHTYLKDRRTKLESFGDICFKPWFNVVLGFSVMAISLGWSFISKSAVLSKDCIISNSDIIEHAFRVPADCGLCANVENVDRVSNITPDDFELNYMGTVAPVIVTDAMTNWSAPQIFDFEFFKEFYDSREWPAGGRLRCSFFPYKTEFRDLNEVFAMSGARANLTEGTEPWYVGWSSCTPDENKELRRHYTRPYFLPSSSESEVTDWIFMGGPGQGAHMHVDNVRYVSWQAQLRGHKRWTLAPPPECYYTCHWFDFVVNPGDIVVVDTNYWYHKTEVIPGGISITIGAEFD